MTKKTWKDAKVLQPIRWYLSWGLPGLGMFSEAYIVFSAGQIGPMQQAMWPTCFAPCSKSFFYCYTDCNMNMVLHLYNYLNICGIMAGMLLWGFMADIVGRKWGSRFVITTMFLGCALLIFTPYATSPFGYFAYFVTAQTWFGFGVGGEYPIASSIAAEFSEGHPETKPLRGRHISLVFSNQGMGNLTNASVILVSMALFGQTGSTLQAGGSAKVLLVSYGVGAFVVLGTLIYRFTCLKESKVFKAEKVLESLSLQTTEVEDLVSRRHWVSLKHYWPRQIAASIAWICNDFAFYGNKLQQGLFLKILYPTATPYIKQQWTVLNSFISLTGYYCAAWLIDKPWYGRRRMQVVGFVAMFIFYVTIYAQWDNMGSSGASINGVKAMQALYYLSSFFNQFGPNVTTWLCACEIFPTDVRASYHGFAACLGKLGAILSALWFSYIVDQQNVFLVSALWGLAGAVVTIIWLPDFTGLNLSEVDRMQRYLLQDRFQDYHGEAVNPKHLSIWEIYVLHWDKQYNPDLDAFTFKTEAKLMAS